MTGDTKPGSRDDALGPALRLVVFPPVGMVMPSPAQMRQPLAKVWSDQGLINSFSAGKNGAGGRNQQLGRTSVLPYKILAKLICINTPHACTLLLVAEKRTISSCGSSAPRGTISPAEDLTITCEPPCPEISSNQPVVFRSAM